MPKRLCWHQICMRLCFRRLTLSKRLRGEARSQGYWAAFAYGSVPWKHRAAEECVVLVSLLVPVSVFGFRQPYSPTGQETTVTREDSEYG